MVKYIFLPRSPQPFAKRIGGAEAKGGLAHSSWAPGWDGSGPSCVAPTAPPAGPSASGHTAHTFRVLSLGQAFSSSDALTSPPSPEPPEHRVRAVLPGGLCRGVRDACTVSCGRSRRCGQQPDRQRARLADVAPGGALACVLRMVSPLCRPQGSCRGRVGTLTPMLSPGSVMVPGLPFPASLHLEFVFLGGGRKWPRVALWCVSVWVSRRRPLPPLRGRCVLRLPLPGSAPQTHRQVSPLARQNGCHGKVHSDERRQERGEGNLLTLDCTAGGAATTGTSVEAPQTMPPELPHTPRKMPPRAWNQRNGKHRPEEMNTAAGFPKARTQQQARGSSADG